jgi:hypothetical protein
MIGTRIAIMTMTMMIVMMMMTATNAVVETTTTLTFISEAANGEEHGNPLTSTWAQTIFLKTENFQPQTSSIRCAHGGLGTSAFLRCNVPEWQKNCSWNGASV